jgi:uncharacterized protein involved in exopolysaccharide biosynthesis
MRRENDVRAALEQQKKRILQLKEAHDEAAVLESDVATAQRDLDAVSQRYAQSTLESQTQQTNMVLLTSATPPFKASSPKPVLVVIGGLVLGMAVAVATVLVMEFMDPRVRGDFELEEILGTPVLVRIGGVTRHRRVRRWSFQKNSTAST